MKGTDKTLLRTVTITVTVLILFFSALIVLLWLKLGVGRPIWLLFLLLLVPAAILIGTVAVLMKKRNNLQKGDKHEAADNRESPGDEL